MSLKRRWLAIAALLGAAPVSAQYQTRAWLDWRTIDAGRFAVHFPTQLEPWARTIAGRINGIDTAVSRIVGFEPRQRIDVIIDDPFGVPNGSAWPIIDAPRLLLWATPPDPRDDIGTFSSWADVLTTHEFTHLAHLLRPSRNPLQSLLWRLSPEELGPISRKAPRWLIEGYATYVEGRVTGSGRPNGVWRPTILREWAIEGALPTYAQLNGTGGMYGGEFAYLAGSAFLEWLAERRGDSSLVLLSRRLSARVDRGFTDAFTGVYGEGPDILYGRFVAELTSEAKGREAELRRVGADSGVTIQHLARETGDPAISRDGGRAAIMLASATRPGRIVIWRTIPEPDTVANRAAQALLARDPEDVAPYRPYPPPKKALATLDAVGSQSFRDPRFFSDGRVLLWRNSAVGDGSWMPDLYVWDPQRHRVRRITRRANVQQGDPAPDGSMVAAMRCGGGKCDLVLVDSRTGHVTMLEEGSDARTFHRPRFSPNGATIAVSVHADGHWRIGLVRLADRSMQLITSEPRDYFDVAFADDSTLVSTANDNGILNVVRLRTDGTGLGRITNVAGAAVAPEVNPADGSVWFLSLHARGWDVRSTRINTPIVLATTGNVAAPHEMPTVPVGPTRPYSPDRKWSYFPLGNAARDGVNLGLGLSNSDPVGVHELLVQAAKGLNDDVDTPWEGASATLTNRRRINSRMSLFAVHQNRLSAPWRAMRGGALSLETTKRLELFSLRATVGGSYGRVKAPDAPTIDVSRATGFAELAASATHYTGARRTTAQITAYSDGGRFDRRELGHALTTASLASTQIPISLTAQYGISSENVASEKFVVGGQSPTLLPPGIFPQFISQPVLPAALIGSRVETYRVSVPFLMLRAYGWMGRAFDPGAPVPFQRVVGAEWSQSIAAIPMLATPAGRIMIGTGRSITRNGERHPWQAYLSTQFGDWVR